MKFLQQAVHKNARVVKYSSCGRFLHRNPPSLVVFHSPELCLCPSRRILQNDGLAALTLQKKQEDLEPELKKSETSIFFQLLTLAMLRMRFPMTRLLGMTMIANVPNRSIHTVVMLRHGESLWNVENRFTGWCDIPLTANGEADAVDAGLLMGERGLQFDVAFTSNLERAWRTCALTLAAAGQSGVETIRSSFLNERHYGALQGHLKDSPKLIEVFGEEKVMEWRRSYHTAPPSLYDPDFLEKIGPTGLLTSSSTLNDKYIDAEQLNVALGNFPSMTSSVFTANAATDRSLAPTSESLQMCEQRAFGYWKRVIAPRVLAGERVLIVAHANTIRALVKAVDNIDDNKIVHLKIPNGIPLVYTMDENLQPSDGAHTNDDIGFQARYLVSARNHGKMMQYERSVQKKLRSLFEYLDVDNDGKITQECLLNGLARLRSAQAVRTSGDETENAGSPPDLSTTSTHVANRHCVNGTRATGDQQQLSLPEYSIEELIRAVPSGDESGGITLKAFLEAEATLLPHLTKLKLLQ